jgi:adhesin/invasin
MGSIFVSARRALALAITIVAAGSSVGCKGSLLAVPSVASAMAAALNSNGQNGVAGVQLAQPLAVQVSDESANPMAGITVYWTVSVGGGTLSAATSVTSSGGIATVNYTLGSLAGQNTVQAALAGGSVVPPVVFAANATAAAVAGLAIASGNGQVVQVGAQAQPLIVITVDKFGNAVPGIAVTWTTTGGHINTNSTVTDANGRSSVVFTADNAVANYTITAKSGTLPSVSFALSSIQTSAIRAGW